MLAIASFVLSLASSTLNDVCKEEDELEPPIDVIIWNGSLETRMHHRINQKTIMSLVKIKGFYK